METTCNDNNPSTSNYKRTIGVPWTTTAINKDDEYPPSPKLLAKLPRNCFLIEYRPAVTNVNFIKGQ